MADEFTGKLVTNTEWQISN